MKVINNAVFGTKMKAAARRVGIRKWREEKLWHL